MTEARPGSGRQGEQGARMPLWWEGILWNQGKCGLPRGAGTWASPALHCPSGSSQATSPGARVRKARSAACSRAVGGRRCQQVSVYPAPWEASCGPQRTSQQRGRRSVHPRLSGLPILHALSYHRVSVSLGWPRRGLACPQSPAYIHWPVWASLLGPRPCLIPHLCHLEALRSPGCSFLPFYISHTKGGSLPAGLAEEAWGAVKGLPPQVGAGVGARPSPSPAKAQPRAARLVSSSQLTAEPCTVHQAMF